jgi:hypothetical protein
MAAPDTIDYDAIYRFLASREAMELVKEAPRVPVRSDASAHAQPDSGWAHRIPMGNPPRRAAGERGGLVRAVPRMREPWPDTAEQWQLYALCSQLRADHRRETERAIRRNHRREMQAMLKAGGVVIGCMLAMGAAYVGAWWLWALVTP